MRLSLLALAALAAAPAAVHGRALKQDAAKPVSWKQGDSLPAITLPTLAEVQSFLASPEVKQVQSWIAEAPPLPKPHKPSAPPKREPKPHRAPHGRQAEEAAAVAQAAQDAAVAPEDAAAQAAQDAAVAPEDAAAQQPVAPPAP